MRAMGNSLCQSGRTWRIGNKVPQYRISISDGRLWWQQRCSEGSKDLYGILFGRSWDYKSQLHQPPIQNWWNQKIWFYEETSTMGCWMEEMDCCGRSTSTGAWIFVCRYQCRTAQWRLHQLARPDTPFQQRIWWSSKRLCYSPINAQEPSSERHHRWHLWWCPGF